MPLRLLTSYSNLQSSEKAPDLLSVSGAPKIKAADPVTLFGPDGAEYKFLPALHVS